MMKMAKSCALLALALVAAACGGERAEEGAVEGDGAAAGVVADSAAAPGAAAEDGTMEVQLEPVGGSGVRGGATLSEQGERVQVTVRLTGLQPSSTHSGHVHQGTCDSLGQVVAPLLDVAADASGSGTSTSLVQLPMGTVMNGQHLIAYHEGAGGSAGAPVVCGAIPAHPM